MRSIVTDRVAWSVGLSVCYTSELCENGWTDRDTVWVEDSSRPREPCIRWESRSTMKRGNFGGKGRPYSIVKYRDFLLWALYRNSWIGRFAVWVVDSGGPKEAQVQSYSPCGANMPTWEGTLGAIYKRIPLNRPSAAAMRSYVKLLWPLVIIIIIIFRPSVGI